MFKNGDKVRIKRNTVDYSLRLGEDDTGVITQDSQFMGAHGFRQGMAVNVMLNTTRKVISVFVEDLELIDNNKNKMNIKEKFALALTSEPMKSFRKVGITNGDDLLTEDGKVVFLSWLLNKKFADEFKKDVVDDMLKDLE